MSRDLLAKKVDMLINDFLTRMSRSRCAKAIRKTFHYSQTTMANKMHYNSSYISDFENEVPLNKRTYQDMCMTYSKMVYEQSLDMSTQDYILWCIRLVCNYGEVCHEDAIFDYDETIKKFLVKFAELYPDFS